MEYTLACGQAFRWKKTGDNRFRGIAFGRVLGIEQKGGELLLDNTDREDFEKYWREYFDLDRDYASICKSFSADKSLKTAVEEYYGIRILRQEPWETLCSFIISQNNNIPRIEGIILRLCESLGEPLGDGNFAFPTPEAILNGGFEGLVSARAGFRTKYILNAAQKISSGEVVLENLSNLPLEDARAELMKIKGVGPKVAECVLLYGLGRLDAFPVDVWVKRVMSEMYPEGLPPCTKGFEGVAQQYLFHWRRHQ